MTPSSRNYQREVSGNFSRMFLPGIYQIGFGVVDVGDFNDSSALVISNAQINPAPITQVPEPGSTLSLFLLAFLGAGSIMMGGSALD